MSFVEHSVEWIWNLFSSILSKNISIEEIDKNVALS